MGSLLEVQNVSRDYRSYGRRQISALREVSFSMEKGRCLGIVGESGCGKSTLCRMIAGIEKPTAGNIFYNQIPVRDRSLRGKIQMVFQNSLDAVNLHMDIFHTVSEPLENFFTMSKAGRRAETVRLLETVGLCAEDLDKYPRQLSGGQLQRICIARALAARPELLLLDEPLSSLDVTVQAQILNLLSDLKKELNLSCILVSHDLEAVYYLADELIVMYGGGVVEKLEDIERFRELCHPYTRRLLMAHEWEDRPDRRKKMPDKILFDGKKSKAEIKSKVGCVYAERCPYVTAQCLVARPELVQRTSGHWVACYR